MIRSLTILSALALAATTSTVFAQQGGQPPQPPARGLEMALALEAAQAAVAACKQQGYNVTVTIVDGTGATKLILVGDDRQLSSIERGGMFGVLKDCYGAAELAIVRRQHKHDDRRAAEMMAEGNFDNALGIYQAKGAIQWTRTQPEARSALVTQWAIDSAADPAKSRFVFAYANADVDQLNRAIRAWRIG